MSKTTVTYTVSTGSEERTSGTDTRPSGRGDRMLAFTDLEWNQIESAVILLQSEYRGRLKRKQANKRPIRRDIELCKSILAKLGAGT